MIGFFKPTDAIYMRALVSDPLYYALDEKLADSDRSTISWITAADGVLTARF
jgi:hypothetical protein